MATETELTSEKTERKYLDAIFWGGVLLWAGLIFGAEYFGFLPQIGNANVWSWIFLGAGVYGLLMSIVRLISENYSNPTTWDWVWSIIFILIGAAGFIAINIPWWLILILIGVAILGGALFRRD
jgi:hypothetical protein